MGALGGEVVGEGSPSGTQQSYRDLGAQREPKIAAFGGGRKPETVDSGLLLSLNSAMKAIASTEVNLLGYEMI